MTMIMSIEDDNDDNQNHPKNRLLGLHHPKNRSADVCWRVEIIVHLL